MTNYLLITSLIVNLILIRRSIKYFSFAHKKFMLKKIIKKILLRKEAILINQPLVFCHLPKKVTAILPSTDKKAHSLPSNLLITKNCYEFNDKHYELAEEGLYRFLMPEQYNLQRIIYTNHVHTLMTSLMWIITHGSRDDHLSYEALIQAATHRKLILTCENSVRFTHHILYLTKNLSRIVGARTLENWNTYDSGHYLIEVFRPDLKQWMLYDIDHQVCFSYQNRYLSLMGLMEHIDHDFKIHVLIEGIKSHIAEKSAYDFSFLDEARVNTLKSWYRRILQNVYIESGFQNESYFSLISQIDEKKNLMSAIHYLPKHQFINKYYLQGTL